MINLDSSKLAGVRFIIRQVDYFTAWEVKMFRWTVKFLIVLLTVLLFSACGGTTQTEEGAVPTTPAEPPVSATMPATPVTGFDCAAVAQIPVAECQALTAFYAAAGGVQWRDNSGWLETSTPCSWTGVTCVNDHVDMLALFFNELQGQLPATLADLPHLRVLDLHNNALTGPIPLELGRLSALEHLDFSANQLNGSIPVTLGDLPALSALYLPYNQLSGAIPAEIGRMASLRHIDLSYNQLEGAIPESLADLASLESLRLRRNQLDGAIPFGLGELAALVEIDLSFNQLTGTVPSALYQVPIHRLWGNQLDGTILLEPDGRQSVNYLGVTFAFDQAIAGSVLPELAPARSTEPGPGIMWAPPEHMVFTFAGTPGSPDHSPMGQYVPPEAQIHIYPTAGLNTEVQPIVAALQQLLADPSAQAAYQSVGPETEPFQPGLAMLPPSNAVQMFRAQVQPLSFAEGVGVRYLTQLSQGPTPINNQDLFYTFQGLTDDGATYIAAYFPIALADLPGSPQIGEEAFMTLMEDWPGYLAQTATLLNAPTAAFTPDLAALDALINSLSVAGAAPMPSITAIWPEDGESVDAQPVLQWEAQPGAVNYQVIVLDDVAFPPQVIIDQAVPEPMLTVDAPLPAGHYSWTVWAYDAAGKLLAELASSFVVADN